MRKKVSHDVHGAGHRIVGLCNKVSIDERWRSFLTYHCRMFIAAKHEHPECVECMCQYQELLYDKKNKTNAHKL